MKHMKLGTKLLVAFLAVGVIPFSAIGITSLIKASNSLKTQAFAQLESMREVKKNQVVHYLETIENQAITFSDNPGIVNAMAQFTEAFHAFRAENQIGSEVIEDQRRKLGVIPQVSHGARGIDIDKDEGPVVNDAEGAFNLDVGLAVLAGGGDEGRTSPGDYSLSLCG